MAQIGPQLQGLKISKKGKGTTNVVEEQKLLEYNNQNQKLLEWNGNLEIIKENVNWAQGIKATQEVIKGTNIPRSFVMEEFKIGGKNIWVHGNATKHMGEFVNASLKRTGQSALVEKEIMLSFKEAVKRSLSKVKPGRNELFVNGWELGINGDTGEIYHALMKK